MLTPPRGPARPTFLSFARFALGAAALGHPGAASAQLEYVDPTIGGIGHLLEPTRPTVSLPNSMVRVYPVRRDATDDQIHSFPLTIISHRLGELFWLMPCAGTPDAGSWDRPAAYDQERTTPYYYSARLDESNIQIEFTPTSQCGYFRFSAPAHSPAVLLANPCKPRFASFRRLSSLSGCSAARPSAPKRLPLRPPRWFNSTRTRFRRIPIPATGP